MRVGVGWLWAAIVKGVQGFCERVQCGLGDAGKGEGRDALLGEMDSPSDVRRAIAAPFSVVVVNHDDRGADAQNGGGGDHRRTHATQTGTHTHTSTDQQRQESVALIGLLRRRPTQA